MMSFRQVVQYLGEKKGVLGFKKRKYMLFGDGTCHLQLPNGRPPRSLQKLPQLADGFSSQRMNLKCQ
jgi:hypothetical protein